jgi:hypothetical protein
MILIIAHIIFRNRERHVHTGFWKHSITHSRHRHKSKRNAAILFAPEPVVPEVVTHKQASKERDRKRRHARCDSPSHESGPESDESISHTIRQLRLQYTNWTYNLGPENLWEVRFNELLDTAIGESQVAVDELFVQLAQHSLEGRNILADVKYAGSGRCDEAYGVLMDLFVQGFELTVSLTSEIKFFEVKVDEYAPATPVNSLSDVRKYSS